MAWCLAATVAVMAMLAFSPAPWLPQLPAIAVLALGVGLLLPAGPCRWLLFGTALAAATSALHAAQSLGARLPASCEGRELTLTGRIAAPVRRRGTELRTWYSLEVLVEEVAPARCSGIRRVRLADGDARSYRAGERWRLQARLRDARGFSNPGARLGDGVLARAGIDARGSVRAADRLDGRVPLRLRHQRLRETVLEQIARRAGPGQGAALLGALAVGDGSKILPSTWERLRALGIVHLFVVSGLHVSLVAGLAMLLGRAFDRVLALARGGVPCPWLAPGCGLLAAGAYAALAGFSLPVLRAFAMLACFCLAVLFARPVASWRNLLVAMAVVELAQPLAASGSGFWLSGGAVVALLWFGRWPRRPGLAGALSLHGYMALAMAPLTIWFFAGASLLAPLANFLLLPVVSIALVPAALIGCGLLPLWPGAAGALWSLAARGTAWGLAALDRLPPAALEQALPPVPPLPLLCLSLLLFAALWAVPLGRGQRALSLLLLLPLLAARPAGTAADPRLVVLDVGQGSAALFLDGTTAVLFDTGGGDPDGYTLAAAVIEPLLRRERADRLDLLVISHADLDHRAGAVFLDRLRRPGRIVLGEAVPGISGERCRPGRVLEAGRLSLTLLSPAPPPGLQGNAASCAVMIEFEGLRVLLPGDIDRERERQLVQYWGPRLKADVLLLSHHGSNSSSSTAFLKHVRPRLAITSAGYGNGFGHPHPAVLERLAPLAIEHLRTDLDGAVTVRRGARGEPVASRARAGLLPYWQRASR